MELVDEPERTVAQLAASLFFEPMDIAAGDLHDTDGRDVHGSGDSRGQGERLPVLDDADAARDVGRGSGGGEQGGTDRCCGDGDGRGEQCAAAGADSGHG